MDQITLHAKIGEALTVTASALEPFIAQTIGARIGSSDVPWVTVLQTIDQERGRGHGTYSVHDPSLQLRALTERLGPLGFPFDNVLPRVGKAYASELRQERNLWAHNEPFTPQTAFRAIDTALQLVMLIGATDEAGKLASIKEEVLPSRPLGTPARDAPGENALGASDATEMGTAAAVAGSTAASMGNPTCAQGAASRSIRHSDPDRARRGHGQEVPQLCDGARSYRRHR